MIPANRLNNEQNRKRMIEAKNIYTYIKAPPIPTSLPICFCKDRLKMAAENTPFVGQNPSI